MTVAELMEELAKMPRDLRVVVNGETTEDWEFADIVEIDTLPTSETVCSIVSYDSEIETFFESLDFEGVPGRIENGMLVKEYPDLTTEYQNFMDTRF